jgi:putative membrane protein
MKSNDSKFVPLITTVSILIPIVVAILMRLPGQQVFGDLSILPLFHATLNGITAVCLVSGFILILNKKRAAHKFCMLAALSLSSVFLVSYVIYHFDAGHVAYNGVGTIRTVYLTILVSHIILATAILPLALFTVYRGLTDQLDKHRRIAKWTLPIWLYVAITGVVIYVMMQESYNL